MKKGNPQQASITKKKKKWDLADMMEVDTRGGKKNKRVQFSTLGLAKAVQ